MNFVQQYHVNIINIFNFKINIAEENITYKRRKSKISLQMEELKNKMNGKEEEESLQEDDLDELLDDELNELNELNELKYSNLVENQNNANKLNKYNIYFYLNINKDNIFIFPIQSDFFNVNEQYIHDLIKNIVKKINDKKFNIKYNSTDYIISLRDIDDDEDNMDFYTKNYELKACKKKNFFPKNDSPSYCPNSLLKNVENENISFISKNSLNIMLRENIN